MATTSVTALNSMNTMRISGLASGLDTESMVTSLMKAERMKYDKLAQQKTLMDWRESANLEVNNLLRDFYDTYLAPSSDTSIRKTSALLPYKVTADPNASVVITANADAFASTHQINSITSLAAGASTESAAQISAAPVSTYTKLSELALSTPLTFDGDGKLSFSINGQTFTFDSTAGDTLQDIINRVNSNADAMVTMRYSSLTGKISIVNRDLGSDSQIIITNIAGNAFADTDAAFGIAQGTYANGADAVLNIDGVDVTRDSNHFVIDGIIYDLKKTAATPIGFTVEQDMDKAIDNVKKFIDAYNTLWEKLQAKLDEKTDRDYQPLTDDQRSEMTEKQIEDWEAKAKTGILHNDTFIKDIMSDLRRSFFDGVDGGANSTLFGFRTETFNEGYSGKIVLDKDGEEKLREALQYNPQQVMQALTAVPPVLPPPDLDTGLITNPLTGVMMTKDEAAAFTYSKSGAFVRLSTRISQYLSDYTVNRTLSSAKASSYKLYTQLKDSMAAEQKRLEEKETQYWNQFTRMEEFISQMNTQSQWMSQQFSSMFGNS